MTYKEKAEDLTVIVHESPYMYYFYFWNCLTNKEIVTV